MSRWSHQDWLLTRQLRACCPAAKQRSTTGPCLYSRRLRIEPLEERRLLALVTVTTLNDNVDFNDGVTSLREAIFATNLVGGADTIDFAAALSSGGPATLTLTQGELAITNTLTINGPGANLLTIDASGNDPTPTVNNGDGSRVFNINDGTNVLRTVAIRENSAGASGGAVFSYGGTSVTLIKSTFSGNSAGGHGGGIYVKDAYNNLDRMTVSDSTISGNSAGGTGGGIWFRSSGTMTVLNSTISGNSATSGGGVYMVADGAATFNLRHSTVALRIRNNDQPPTRRDSHVDVPVFFIGMLLIRDRDRARVSEHRLCLVETYAIFPLV